MDLEWIEAPKDINGINLANYVPQQRTFDSVVFLHKRYIKKPFKKDKTVEAKLSRTKHEIGLQVSPNKCTEHCKEKHKCNKKGILEQTIKFAKDITPLVIPPSDDRTPVYYTIKTSKKHKNKKPCRDDHEKYDKNDAKKVVETFRKVRKESFSVRESVSHSTNNTLDDLNMNPSLSCSFSEVSEKTYHKKEKNQIKTLINNPKVVVSESFEALATDNISNEAKIKIHLMNEKDKHIFSENIKTPILNAIKGYILELTNNNEVTLKEVSTVQKVVKNHDKKLDNIFEKLVSIERKLDNYIEETKILAHEIVTMKQPPQQMSKPTPKLVPPKEVAPKLVPPKEVPPKLVPPKVSALEEIGEDLAKEDYSSEEELHQERLDRRSKSDVIMISQDDNNFNEEISGGGEMGLGRCPAVKARPERPNRLPARFCWTDAMKK